MEEGGGMDSLSFWLQGSSSGTTICNTSIFRVRDKESVNVSAVTTAYALGRQGEITTVPALTNLLSTLGAWHSLNWLNGWGREKNIWWGL